MRLFLLNSYYKEIPEKELEKELEKEFKLEQNKRCICESPLSNIKKKINKRTK